MGSGVQLTEVSRDVTLIKFKATTILKIALGTMHGDALKATVLAIRTIRSTEAENALLELSTDDRETVRLAVIEAWEGTSDQAAISQLNALMQDDPSRRVREAAKQTIETL